MTTIIKSPNDRRLFKHLRLTNDLEALIISDPLTQKSAASLSVAIGSNNDDVEGIAHFLEHMLFMGSVKYPNENDYNTYIKENGGSSNAFTSSDHTNYYFDCVPEGLFKVLDIFAQFFINPLLKEDGVKRELNAVDSEYQNSLTHDGWRFSSATKQFMRPIHPKCKFNMGCVATLDIPDIREKVLSFYNKYYSSHLMKLVVVGKESLEELEQNVISMFSLVPRRNVLLNADYGKLYDAPIFGKVIPMKDEHKLDLSWEFVLDDKYDAYHIDDFMGHIVGHEGEGSLFDLLYQKFLAKSLHAGVSEKSINYKIMSVSIHLTDNGFKNIELVKQIVLQYVQMFSTSSYENVLRLYNEYRRTRETEFKNYVVDDACHVATALTSHWSTHEIRPEYLIAHPYLFNDYDLPTHQLLMSILSAMTYNNSVIFVRSKSFEGTPEFSEEKWYKVKYMRCNVEPMNYIDLGVKLTLPFENKYICNNVSINKELENTKDDPELLPLEKVDLWWKYDTSYNTPDIKFSFNVIIQNDDTTDKDRVLKKVYFKCLNHVTNAGSYNINLANYSAHISQTTNGLSISVDGYPEKFMNVLDFYVQSLLHLKDNLNEDIFNNIKKLYQQELDNQKFAAPRQMISYELSTHVVRGVNKISKSQEILRSLTYDDLLNYELFNTNNLTIETGQSKKRLIKCTSNNTLYGLVQGNITYDSAIAIGEYMSQLNLLNDKYELREQLKETHSNEFTKVLENKDESNSCYKLAIRIGYLRPVVNPDYVETSSMLQILDEIIGEQYFDQLRTKEQLGYAVYSSKNVYGNDFEQPYTTYDFCVQSPSKDTEFLKERTMRFVREFKDFLNAETEESINNVINSQILQLEKPFQNLGAAASYNFSTITKYCANFNFNKDKKEFMKTINKQKLIEFYEEFFSLEEGTYWSMRLESQSKISTN